MTRIKIIFLAIGTIAFALLGLFTGSVNIPASDVIAILTGHSAGNDAWRFIVLNARLPQLITASLTGAALAVSGLLLQTTFHNPLAAPDIFGLNSGAGLGVALVMLVPSALFHSTMSVLLAAGIGAGITLGVILAISQRVRDNVTLLIVGMMVGFVASSAITLLNFFATEQGVKAYALWGMGDFSNVSPDQMPAFVLILLAGLMAATMMAKPLNAMLLGHWYAENLGINTRRIRFILLATTGALTATATAWCGPIAFVGLAVPHMSRLLLRTDDHRLLLPSTMLFGAAVCLLCNVICYLPGENGYIPVNAITPLIGAPVIIWIIMKHRTSINS